MPKRASFLFQPKTGKPQQMLRLSCFNISSSYKIGAGKLGKLRALGKAFMSFFPVPLL